MAQDYGNPSYREPRRGDRDDARQQWDARQRNDARRAEMLRQEELRRRQRAAGRTSQRITVTEHDDAPEGDRGTAYQQDLDRRHAVRRDIDSRGARRPRINRDDVRRSADRYDESRSAAGRQRASRSADSRSGERMGADSRSRSRSGSTSSSRSRSDNRQNGARRDDRRRSGGRSADERSGRRPAGRSSRGPRPNQVILGPTGIPPKRGLFGFDLPPFVLIIAAVIVVIILVLIVRSCSGGSDEEAAGAVAGSTAQQETSAVVTAAGSAGTTGSAGSTTQQGADATASSAKQDSDESTQQGTASTAQQGAAATAATLPASGSGRVSFVAVGDNLPDDLIGYWADAQAGSEGDGTYDYTGLYTFIKPYVASADLAYMKEETHLRGNDIGPRGYPSFNTTDEMADAVVDAGFDFVASASNHAYDWGLYGAIDHSLSVWETKPVAFTGTSVTEEQYNRIATLQKNGITFALLDYTYGVNWPDTMELPEHSINFIDEDRIASDVDRAKQQADVVLVAMHWGTELLMEADEQQQHLAQFLANLDVDVVLGSHPHVIGPVEWVANEDGGGHKTLVVYSLGNFLSDHEVRSPQVELEGMLCCDFVRAGASGSADADAESTSSATTVTNAKGITIENVRWVPLVNHTNADRTDFGVYALKDYTNELGKLNAAYADNDVDDPIKWLREKTHEVIGSAVPIDDGTNAIAVVGQNADQAIASGGSEAAVDAAVAAKTIQV